MPEPLALSKTSVAATGDMTARIIRRDSLALCESELDQAIADITEAVIEDDPLRRAFRLSLAKCRIRTALVALCGAKS